MKTLVSTAILSLCVMLISSSLIEAQERWDGPVALSEDYLLTNATLVPRPGVDPQLVNIWLKDGKIHQVGPNVTGAIESEVIDLDSMYVYSGFIDGLSHTAVKAPEKKDDDKKERFPGINTYVQAADQVQAGHSSIAKMRKLGYTISHSVPKGRTFSGQGALILLQDGEVEDLLLQSGVSQMAKFQGAGRGKYPNTVIGVMAKWRDLYRNTSIANKHMMQHKSNPGSSVRPSYDKTITGFLPVVSQGQDVYFETGSALQIHRAMRLQEELGFDMVLAGVDQIWMCQDAIKDWNGHIILTDELPDELDEEKEDLSEEESGFRQKRQEVYDLSMAQAAMLEKMNKAFSISSYNTGGKDVLPNIRKMIAAGLSEDAALAALTTNPAQLLGISQYAGSVDQGKMANLVVADKNIFEEGAVIRYVFVEGKKYDYEKKKVKKEGNASSDINDVLGTWEWKSNAMGTDITGGLVITQDDGNLVITQTNSMDDKERTMSDPTYENGVLSFNFSGTDGISFTIEASIEGDQMEGTLSIPNAGDFGIEAERVSKPE